MQVRELVQPSSTCDVRGHLAASALAHAANAPTTSIYADLRTAAADMMAGQTTTLWVLDRDRVSGVTTLEDLLRGAVRSGDQQLNTDLGAQMQDPVAEVPLAGGCRAGSGTAPDWTAV